MYNNRGNILSGLPQVTKILLIVNVVLFVLTLIIRSTSGIDLKEILALYNAKSEAFSPYQIISHMFMHADMGHVFFNMFGLFIFGKVLESVLGSQKFFTLYFVSGLAAAALQLGINQLQVNGLIGSIEQLKLLPSPEAFWALAEKYHFSTSADVQNLAQGWMNAPDDPGYIQQAYFMCERMVYTMINGRMVGASGAVLGVVAAFAVMFPNVELMIIFFPVPIKAKYLIPIYIVASLFFGVTNVAFNNVAHFAHIGGAVAGFILVMFWKKNQFNNRML